MSKEYTNKNKVLKSLLGSFDNKLQEVFFRVLHIIFFSFKGEQYSLALNKNDDRWSKDILDDMYKYSITFAQ